MLGDAGGGHLFNSTFENWVSASVVNPRSGFRFCREWFLTHVSRGQPMQITVEPLEPRSERGVRLLLTTPPEQVRLWHALDQAAVDGGGKAVRVRLRGVQGEGPKLQLDSIALFNGNDEQRKVDRRLIGAVPLNRDWHEFAVPLKPSGAAPQGQRYLSLRFSGAGKVEIEFCRIEDPVVATRVLASAKSFAAKLVTGFRRTAPAAGGDGLHDEAHGVVEPPLVVSAGTTEVTKVKIEPAAEPPPAASPTVSNVLVNADFEKWKEDEPAHWSVTAPPGVTIKRESPTRERPFATPCLAVVFGKSPANHIVSIAQRIEGFSAQQFVDVVVVGRADARTEVEVALTNSSGKIIPGARTTVILWSKWLRRTAHLRLPAKLEAGQQGIALILRDGQGSNVQLAFVAAGPAGEAIGQEFKPRQVPLDSNAVVNGRFEHWSGRLKLALATRRTEITDEWLLAAKSPCSAVEARLTEIAPRGLKDGRDHSSVPALALHGEIAGPNLRLEAGLDSLQILAASPRQLGFCARSAELVEAAGERKALVIQQIIVAERRRIAPDKHEFDVRRLFTIRKNVRVGRIGEYHTLPLRNDHRQILEAKARETLHDAGHSLVLIFEFADFVDIAIGDVYLGSGAAVAENAGPQPHKVMMEDANIAGQLAQLKGLEHWQSTQPIQAEALRSTAGEDGPVSWTWLPGSKFSVDIVICVYNAVEETLDCLESIAWNTSVPHTVTIIDDKSGDTTRMQLRSYVRGKPWIRLIENEENLGYTKSANIGMSRSSAEWVVLLNSDTIVTPGWLEGMFEAVEAHPKAAMIGPVSNAASWQSVPELHDVKGGWSSNPLPEGVRPEDVSRLVNILSPKQFPEATLLNGFCTLMKREVIEQVGYLDEVAFPMGYGEENDLCLRVRKAGYTLVVADHVYIYHVKSASFGSARRAELSKRGTAQLALKHPEVDMKAVQREMAELTSLTELRKKLRVRLHGGSVKQTARPAGKVDKSASVSATVV
ncbi:MAG: glycosyltransferase family 2 protein [Rhodospirillales bacterium]|nr:glycosyltransferase family 2 protein [Rhodospirillales bacterium]